MLTEKTTLVLGAGASFVFGLPLGSGLRDTLRSKLDIRFDDWGTKLEHGSSTIVNALREHTRNIPELRGNIGPYQRASREIANALPVCSSIDDYIERHAGNEEYELCAKLGIAETIVQAEHGSSLKLNPRVSDTVDLTKFGNCWLSIFLQNITRGIHKDEIGKAFEDLRVIIFNYDRCFEQFTFYWIKQLYKIADDEAEKIVSSIQIVHPYGSLGVMWPTGSPVAFPFGGGLSDQRLLDVSQNIRTYSESIKDDDKSLSIHEYINESRKIIFLGFAFHSQNIDLLNCAPSNGMERHIFATTVQIPRPRWESIQTRLRRAFDVPPERFHAYVDHDSCESLLAEYSDAILDN